jgi:hypothetical protein
MPLRIVVIYEDTLFPKELHVSVGDTLQFHSDDADFDVTFTAETPINVQSIKGKGGVQGPQSPVTGQPGTYPYTAMVGGQMIDPDIIVDPGP